MKELDSQVLEPEKIVLEKQKEIKKEVKYLGKLKLHKSQKLFKLDCKTHLITPVVFNTTTVEISGEIRRKYVIEDNCLYAPAINVKNAERKFLKMFK